MKKLLFLERRVIKKRKLHNMETIRILANSSNARINTNGNVVPYHTSKVSLLQEKAFKDIGKEIANNIWKTAMSTFNNKKIDHHFHEQ